MKDELLKKLDLLHEEGKNEEIIKEITALKELDYDVLGRLARAYNNNEEYQKGLDILLSTKEEGKNDSVWNFRIGYSYYFLNELKEAEKYFLRALELNPKEPNADYFLQAIYSSLLL